MKVYVVEILNQIDETYTDIKGVYTSRERAYDALKEEYQNVCEQVKDCESFLEEFSFEVCNDDYKIEGFILEENIHFDPQTLTDLTGDIIEEFDKLLCNNNIMIPDEEREGSEDEAAIYGKTYYELEDTIKDMIDN